MRSITDPFNVLGAVLNLFLDWHKFKGMNIKPKLAAFNNSLKNNYNYQEICSYFSV